MDPDLLLLGLELDHLIVTDLLIDGKNAEVGSVPGGGRVRGPVRPMAVVDRVKPAREASSLTARAAPPLGATASPTWGRVAGGWCQIRSR